MGPAGHTPAPVHQLTNLVLKRSVPPQLCNGATYNTGASAGAAEDEESPLPSSSASLSSAFLSLGLSMSSAKDETESCSFP